MNETFQIPVSNRFVFLAQLKDKLHQRNCDLATYKSHATRSHYRDPEDINPKEYAILGPIIDTRKSILGIKIGHRPASKVLCNVITEYPLSDDSQFIDKIKFYVFGQENIDLVKKIVSEDYAPLLIFGDPSKKFNIVVASSKSNIYENFH